MPEAARDALVQIDGSPFAWLETRGPQLTLLGAVDDATTTLFQQLCTRHGRPREEELASAQFPTHLGRTGETISSEDRSASVCGPERPACALRVEEQGARLL